jgi:hypothetical protein
MLRTIMVAVSAEAVSAIPQRLVPVQDVSVDHGMDLDSTRKEVRSTERPIMLSSKYLITG